MKNKTVTLFELALDYALLRRPAWGHVLVCLRSDAGFGYRLHLHVPVISVPDAEVDPLSLSLLAYLFGRHAVRMSGSCSVDPFCDAWIEAEAIYGDLCSLAKLPYDHEAFHAQRSLAFSPTGQTASQL